MADDIVVVPSSDPHQGEVVFVDAAFYEGDSAPPSDRGDAALISNRTASTIEADSPEDVDDPSPDPHSVLHPGGRPSLKGGGRRLLITASTVTVIALIGAAVHGLVGRESVAANDAATDGSGAEPISVPSPMHTGVPATLEDDTTGVVPRADNTAGRLPNSLSRSSSGDAAATSVPGGEPVVPGGEPVVPGGEPVVPGEPAAPVSGVSAVSATLNDKDQVVLRWSFDAGKGAEPYMFIIESSDGTMVAHTNGYGIRSGLLPAPPAGTSIAYCVYPAADDYGPDGQPVKIGLGACSNTITVGA